MQEARHAAGALRLGCGRKTLPRMASKIPNVTASLYGLLARTAADAPHAIAIAHGDAQLTYAQLEARAGAVADLLAQRGVREGDRVAILLERSAEAVACFFGILRRGGIAVVINDRLRPRQMEHVLGDSGASALLTSAEMLGRQPRPLDTSALVLDVADAGAGSAPPVTREATDVAVIVYTSGSSGLPKGVAHTHGGLMTGVEIVVGYLAMHADDRVASLLPLSSVYGMNQMLCTVKAGGTLLIELSPLAHQIVTALRARGVTIMAGVPPLWLQLLAVPDFAARPIATLRQLQNAGGHLPADAVRKLRAAQPQAQIFLQYGMTETFRSTFLPPADIDQRPDSMGRAMPDTEILVVREDGSPCDPDETGELVHLGTTLAAGYWNAPEATSATFRRHPFDPAREDRAVFSGDMVRRDAAGYLYFVGRRDRMIKTLGFRVGPDEIGDVVHASGEVREVVVVGEPDPDRGERIVAHVVLKPEGSLDRLTRFCKAELPRHMHPARYQGWDKLPRLASGKYDLETLKQQQRNEEK